VYKALEALVAIGVASRLTGSDESGPTRYDARIEEHYHFRCLRTGAVYDLPTRFDPHLVAKLDPELTSQLQRKGFRVTGYRLELVGYQDPGVSPLVHGSGHERTADVPTLRPTSQAGGNRA
jgi:Fe2+ or Zn2+ uptake regulation protein